MRLPCASAECGHLEPASSPVLPLSCLLSIVVALGVVDVRLGSRLALIAAVFAAVSIATRLPGVLPVTAAVCLAIAGTAVLATPAAPLSPRTSRSAPSRAHTPSPTRDGVATASATPPRTSIPAWPRGGTSSRASRRSAPALEMLGSQEQLFRPAPPEPPSFDELCPPLPVEQLELEVDAAIRACGQTTIDDYTTAGA